MKTKEMIKALEKKGYKIKEPESRFLKVKVSDRGEIFLIDENKNNLVRIWATMENRLNDFEYFEKEDAGHFWINGDACKFEFKYKGKWLECNNIMDVRFLR